MRENIHLFYTNDLHSHFEHWARIVHFFKENKTKIVNRKESCFLFDIGDHMDRVSPIAEAFMGKANVELLNAAEYDVVTLGNNEGITLSHDDLYHLYDDANFSVVCSNMHNLIDEQPPWLKISTQLISENGVRIAVLGLTAPYSAYYQLLGWQVDFPQETLERHLAEVKKDADIIILLSHLGLNEDRQIAMNHSEIDIIIGGHTHHLLRTGEMVEETLLTAAGKNGEFVGNVLLTWDHTNQKLINKEAYAINIAHLPKDEKTVEKLSSLQQEANTILSVPVVHTEESLEVDWSKSTPIIKSLTETLKEWTKADCAMLNTGLLLESFPSGTVSYEDVHRICPHPINPCVVELDGDELMEVIRSSYTSAFTEFALKGFGFRGKKLGKMVFSGLEIETIDYGNHESIKRVFWNGEPLQKERTYSVATADMFTFGRLLPEISRSESKIYYLPEFIRDLLVLTLKKMYEDDEVKK